MISTDSDRGPLAVSRNKCYRTSDLLRNYQLMVTNLMGSLKA